MIQRFSKYGRLYLLAGLFIVNFCIWYAVNDESRTGLSISFLNVGQGDSIFIDAPSGNQVLVDGGPDRTVSREISKALPFYDRRIDLFVVSNTDKDHLAGLVDIMKKYRVGAVLEPGTFSNTAIYSEFEETIKESGIKKFIVHRGTVVDLGGGATIEVLFPDRDASGMKTNDGSLVVRLKYGKTSVMLTGDMPSTVENYLVSLGGDLKSDILKVGHHGSRTSTSETFLGYVSPKFAVISSGKNNSYGHPHKEVLDRLNQFAVNFFNTAEVGQISFFSDGEKFVKK